MLPPGRALRTVRWKYAVTAEESYVGEPDAPVYHETHLYDLRTDPYELSNLVSFESHRELRAKLQKRLLERMNRIGEPPASIQSTKPVRSGQRTVDYPNERTFRRPESSGS